MKKYNLIYADPPWQYSNQSTRAATKNHYPTMTFQELKSLNIKSIADNNSILIMWYTSAFARQADALASHWGFEVKTMKLFTWVKLNKNYHQNITKQLKQHGCMNSEDVFNLINDQLRFGLGNYTRANSEDCLIAVRGKGIQRINKSVSQIILAPIGAHSAKPQEARDRIVQLYGNVPRVELFARQNVNGWDAWGNECINDIEL
ncbi:DNA methyltransferase [Gilliamella sp. B3482]|uniref:MT-A70 family methyltransferase n=1 Tax=Gilliamella sp. B3482 TaxID=2817991 RepID=UPI00226A1D90|nr:MT-A70 family methyltransferase [Gilliamella sp. B3482]MCX8580117.1 DNA methyltransferase [Gilliamella sp. B3482]